MTFETLCIGLFGPWTIDGSTRSEARDMLVSQHNYFMTALRLNTLPGLNSECLRPKGGYGALLREMGEALC